LGSLLAARLTQARQDVYLLAPGDRLVNLRQNGIRLQNMLTGQQENVQINLVERLAPQDAYDLVIVVMGKHQVPAVLPVLAANIATSSVLFIGHNAAGPPEVTAALGNERPLLGFYGAGGAIREGVVYYGDGVGKRKGRLTFGELWVEHPPAGSNQRFVPECGHPGCSLHKYGCLAENACRADPANSRSAVLGRWRYVASGG